MRNKVEIGLYVAGGVAFLSAVAVWISKKKAPVPLFIAAGGLGASGFALRLYQKETGKAFGLAEVGRVRRGESTQKLWHDKEMGLEERIHLLQELKTKSTGDPDVRRLALAVTGHGDRTIQVGREDVRVKGRKCPARDDKCELEAIFDFAADPVNLRYTGDVGPTVLHKGQPAEAVDFFATVRRAIEQRGEDCDGHAVVNATLASLNGFTTRYRVTSNHGDSWDHIYALVGLPKNDPKKWVAMDTTLDRPKLGREPYFAKHKDFEA